MYSVLEQLEQSSGTLSVKEVAKILGVTAPTIYKIANSKDLPGLQVAGKWVFDPKTVAHWVRRQNPAYAKT